MDLVMVAMPLVAVNKVWKRLQNVYSGSVVPSLPNTTAEGDPGACCAICDKRVDWQQVQRLVPGAQGGERDRPT
eukprot:m.270063 g.270063  ORF g.270063 m.270063 type:complete len:74 (-) comp19309_c0_seq8:454-675(-)